MLSLLWWLGRSAKKGLTLLLIVLVSRFGDKALGIRLVCPQIGTAVLTVVNPVINSTALPLWGKNTQILSSLTPKRDRGPRRAFKAERGLTRPKLPVFAVM